MPHDGEKPNPKWWARTRLIGVFRQHYFDGCDICLHWWWPHDAESIPDYPACQTGTKIMKQHENAIDINE